MSINKTLKACVFGTARRPMRIRAGLYRGLTLALDPTCELSYFFGTFERETQPWLRDAISRARSVVDVGAGSGELVAWSLAHRQIERVVAYEPDRNRWPVFHENLRLNRNEEDERLVSFQREFLGTESQQDLALLNSLPEPILLKIDIDGGEQAVLSQMSATLVNQRCLVLVETHSRQLHAACELLLRDAGYVVRQVPQARWRCLLRETRMDFNQWLVAER